MGKRGQQSRCSGGVPGKVPVLNGEGRSSLTRLTAKQTEESGSCVDLSPEQCGGRRPQGGSGVVCCCLRVSALTRD